MNRHAAVALALTSIFLFSPMQVPAQDSLPQLVKKIQPAVVTILHLSEKGKFNAIGTGFFINPQGHIITNRHVLAATGWPDNPYAEFLVSVKTSDGKSYSIKGVLADDKKADLVKLAIDMPRASEYLQISRSLPEVGERVVVVGSPLGLEQTLSDGVVSAVRKIPDLGEILQITAPISPGSSGSPVVNMKGEVIGVATLQMVKGQNLNFAVPGSRILALQQRAAGPPTARATPEPKSPTPPSVRKPDPSMKESPGFAEVLEEQALKFYKAGDYAKAAEALRQVIRLDPDYGRGWAQFFLGINCRNLGRYHEALAAFKHAIRLTPDFAESHRFLGRTYADLKRYQDAKAPFKEAIRLKPDDAEAHFFLAGIYLELGNRSAALEQYKILQKLDPKMAEGLFNVIYP